MRVRILVVPDSRAHPRLRNLLKWPSTMQQSLQKPEYNLQNRRRYFSPWIFTYLNSNEHGFFYILLFTLVHVRLQADLFIRQLCSQFHQHSLLDAPWNYRKKAPQSRGDFMIWYYFHWISHFSGRVYATLLIFSLCRLLKNPIGKHVPRWHKKNIAPEISFQDAFIRWKFDLCPISYIANFPSKVAKYR